MSHHLHDPWIAQVALHLHVNATVAAHINACRKSAPCTLCTAQSVDCAGKLQIVTQSTNPPFVQKQLVIQPLEISSLQCTLTHISL